MALYLKYVPQLRHQNKMIPKNNIDQFLEELSLKDFDKYELLTRIRNIVLKMYPNVTETIKYGGIIFSLEDSFGGLFASKNHVSFEFTYGYKLTSNLKLEGSGKYRRHLKIKAFSDDLEENLILLLEQIGSIDNS